MNHEKTRMTMASGNMNDIHSPKPMLRFMPSGSLRYLRAMALGGVPMGVPMPPMLAPTGMASARPMRPLPSAGRALSTGVRNEIIMAAVAVLLMNIENSPVTSRKPSRTFSDLVPKSLSSTLASSTSRPHLVAAMARMNPPRNSMIIGSAKVAMMALPLTMVP